MLSIPRSLVVVVAASTAALVPVLRESEVATPALTTKSAAPDAAASHNWGTVRWEVTVTNLTRGQIFSPPVVAVHSQALPPVWELGAPASPELAGVAEDAANMAFINALQASGATSDVQTILGVNGPILPGESASVIVQGNRHFHNRLSMAGMLVITNDAFFGLNGVRLPSWGCCDEHFSPAYDAGSEANTELCAHIPGPPCNSGGVRMTTGAEGYVHIHAGIHGVGDLAPETYDWRNGVARIQIRRVY
ncbi:MAG: spondin domain-containing protein [Planctomycetes bacterium]|nr:spondin domain-containing protein [Planctomycetota bacterium]